MSIINKINVVLLIAMFCACTSHCPNDKLKELMGDLYRVKISIPDSLKLLNPSFKNNAEIYSLNNDYFAGADFFILYYFDASCSDCVKNLMEIKALYEENEQINNSNVKYIIIGTSTSSNYLAEALTNYNFPLPVYYEEKYNNFKKLNNLELYNNLYNTAVLNEKKEVLLFGSFFNNKKAEKMLLKIINCS